VGFRSLYGHPAGRILAKKVSSGQKIWLRWRYLVSKTTSNTISGEVAIGELQDFTTTSYLAAKAEMENGLASTR